MNTFAIMSIVDNKSKNIYIGIGDVRRERDHPTPADGEAEHCDPFMFTVPSKCRLNFF